jgi:hypothetical protein
MQPLPTEAHNVEFIFNSAREAGGSIKPGVKRSETPGPRRIENLARGAGDSG